MSRCLHVMFTRCTDPAREDELDRGYTHVHVPDLSRAPGRDGMRARVASLEES